MSGVRHTALRTVKTRDIVSSDKRTELRRLAARTSATAASVTLSVNFIDLLVDHAEHDARGLWIDVELDWTYRVIRHQPFPVRVVPEATKAPPDERGVVPRNVEKGGAALLTLSR